MKYPQLVSTRAVREISDWLIKRLEELDIEQPGVYSRLLLSLLHTPFKVNAIDLLEIPQLKDLKQPYHFLNKNNEELKRLAAVESLMEVSTGANKSNIITLVDELHLKLRKIESSCEENTISRASTSATSTSPIVNSKLYKDLKKIKRYHGSENPTKNYYLAFPALSSKKTTTSITSGELTQLPSCETRKDSNLQLLCWSNLISSTMEDSHKVTSVSDCEKMHKKSRPRRARRYGRRVSIKNQKDVQCNTDSHEGGASSPKAKNIYKKHQRNQYVTSKSNGRNCGGARNNHYSNSYNASKLDFSTGSTIWDMDFKGNWEMDRDLISEFIQKQQQRPKTLSNPYDKNTTEQVEQTKNKEEDEAIMMKFLPNKLMDESQVNDPTIENEAKHLKDLTEAQSISSLKSKFDANVKALWNDVDDPLTAPLSYTTLDDRNTSFGTSFISENNSLILFKFNGHQPYATEVHNLYNTGMDFMNISNFDDINSKNSGRDALPKTHQTTSAVSPEAEKFIRSGTNLQASIWSDGEFASEPENLVHKDVVDHSDDAIYKQIKTIGAEMKNWQKACVQDYESDVSLFNHSDASAFKRFRPLIAPTIIRSNYHPSNKPPIKRTPVEDDSENLLTSEKTHFSPIILDGHTFVIDSNWDEIKYERSCSGSLTHNSKRYLEWDCKQLDNLNVLVSEGSEDLDFDLDLEAMEENASSDFTIRFLVKDENEKGCQTEKVDFLRSHTRSYLEINEEYCKWKIYDEYSKGIYNEHNKWRYQLNANESDDYSFFSVNRVKSDALAPPNKFQNMVISSNSSSSSICTITSSSYDTSAVDPFESWRSIKVENGDMYESESKLPCLHSLWEPCTICSANNFDNKEKTIPADTLLKHELQMDGDEIMNVIQNLYITGDYCDEEKDEDDGEDMNHFYMDMCDDMDAEEESKFYEAVGKKTGENVRKSFSPCNFLQQQREQLFQLEKFDDISVTNMHWQWNKDWDNPKYLKILKMIQTSAARKAKPDTNNNETNNFENGLFQDELLENTRKRRHSTCQNLMESKMFRLADRERAYLNMSQSPTTAELIEDQQLCLTTAKILKRNIEKILLIADAANAAEFEQNFKDENGANYYRNIMQQQHALIKSMDLARPLTR